jgi:hypothetical protein
MHESRTCDLDAMLFRFGSVNTSYDTNAGLKRSMVMSGWIDDRPYPDDRFHGKNVDVVISAPRDPELEGRITHATKVDQPCGFAQINANVEPKKIGV